MRDPVLFRSVVLNRQKKPLEFNLSGQSKGLELKRWENLGCWNFRLLSGKRCSPEYGKLGVTRVSIGESMRFSIVSLFDSRPNVQFGPYVLLVLLFIRSLARCICFPTSCRFSRVEPRSWSCFLGHTLWKYSTTATNVEPNENTIRITIRVFFFQSLFQNTLTY